MIFMGMLKHDEVRGKGLGFSPKKVAVIVIIFSAAIILLCIHIFYSTPQSPHFKGAYFNYTVIHPFVRDGYMYIKILNVNETHEEYLMKVHIVTVFGTTETSKIECAPRENPNFIRVGTEKIVYNTEVIECEKYVSRDGSQTNYIYKGVAIKIVTNDGTVYILKETNTIKIP